MQIIPRRPSQKRKQAQPILLDPLAYIPRIATQIRPRMDRLGRIFRFAYKLFRSGSGLFA
jgi:hypothetical protein